MRRKSARNLQDHIDVGVLYECTKPITLYSLLKGRKQPMVGIEYMLQGHRARPHHPPALRRVPENARRTRSARYPAPLRQRADARSWARQSRVRRVHHPYLPAAPGKPRHRAALPRRDPFAAPSIDPRYLAEANDMRTMRDAIRMVARYRGAGRVQALFRGDEIAPGAELRTDCELDAWIAPDGGDALPPRRHRAHGHGRESAGGWRTARARHGWLARHRRVGDADAHRRQHQRANDHDRGKSSPT